MVEPPGAEQADSELLVSEHVVQPERETIASKDDNMTSDDDRSSTNASIVLERRLLQRQLLMQCLEPHHVSDENVSDDCLDQLDVDHFMRALNSAISSGQLATPLTQSAFNDFLNQ